MMSETHDFERDWLAKFSNCVLDMAGDEVRRKVMEGSQALNSNSEREDVIRWSKAAVTRLEAFVGETLSREIMTGCACQYPTADLQEIRKNYEETGSIETAHQLLQSKFDGFLREMLRLDEELISEIVERRWGLAGEIKNDTIIAIKIPKSEFLVEYMREEDPQKKRQYYCHCPRVRDAIARSETISATYCYCGAGFYKGIWEEILQEPVEVEVLETVLQGGDVCRIAIHLSK